MLQLVGNNALASQYYQNTFRIIMYSSAIAGVLGIGIGTGMWIAGKAAAGGLLVGVIAASAILLPRRKKKVVG